MSADLQALSVRLGHRFAEPALLEAGLTHGSASGSSAVSNQRLEFLGDAALGLAVGEALYRGLPQATEGDLTRTKARYVNNVRLAEAARVLGLGPCLRLSKDEHRRGGRENERILADAFEAVVGALYLDGGMDAVREAVSRYVMHPAPAGVPDANVSSKHALQEWLQARGRATPEYSVVSSSGPAHRRSFRVEARCGPLVTVGVAGRKRLAEERAAAEALSRLAGPEPAAEARSGARVASSSNAD